ncbi:MAG: class II aldolase/adducin family protein [Clostridia bacterium]|nr:class II aldolase/adducin family protein [Clostridia bacterium]
MDILTAKKEVIEAGKKLVATGLIARTWGNVSCRVNDKSFVITPSGKAYDGLTPDDIVEVSIDTLEYSGDVKPSSEKGVHAEVYKAHPEAGFVIHTHQKFASIVSATADGIPMLSEKGREVIGERVLLASYGLPGTKKLKKGVIAALNADKNSKAVIMAHHGAVCFGADSEEAFNVSATLERESALYILDKFEKTVSKKAEDLSEMCTLWAGKGDKALVNDENDCYNNSYRDADGKVVFYPAGNKDLTLTMDLSTGKISGDGCVPMAATHCAIYKAREDINSILYSKAPEVVAVASKGKAIRPQLDDSAQIIGRTFKCAKDDSPDKVVKALKGRHGVLIKDGGALCCGSNESNAGAVEMIAEKSCMTYIGSGLFGKQKPINPVECLLMRVIYLKKYSKQAE